MAHYFRLLFLAPLCSPDLFDNHLTFHPTPYILVTSEHAMLIHTSMLFNLLFLISGIPLPPFPTQYFYLSFEIHIAFPDHSHLF